MAVECSRKKCVDRGIPPEPTVRSMVIDVVISIVLLGGAGITDYVGRYFYPDGVPFPYSAILWARDIATLLWVISSVFYHFRHAYREFSLTITRVHQSKFWRNVREFGYDMKRWWAKNWEQMDGTSKHIVWMIVIVLLGLGVEIGTGFKIYFVIPVIYWGGVFIVAYVAEQRHARVGERFWLMALLLFLLILAIITVIGADKIPILQLIEAVSRDGFARVARKLLIWSIGTFTLWWLYKSLQERRKGKSMIGWVVVTG